MQRAFPRRLAWLIPILCLLITGVSVTVVTMVTKARAAVGSNAALSVYVGYAENKEINTPNPANFPVPWAGAPNTIFLGGTVPGQTACGSSPTCYDTGAIRLDNSGTTDISVSNVTANLHADMTGGKIFSLWGTFTVPAGKSVILAADPPNNNPGYDNFDTSGYPPNHCNPITEPPTVSITIGGVATVLSDSTHVLDTGGIDRGYCKQNESIQWRAIGAAGVDNATISLYPANANPAVGTTTKETAFLQDGSGYPTPNALVNFSVTAGPDAGKTGSAYTDTTGHAAFNVTNTTAGVDTVVASVTTLGTFQTQTSLFWGPGPTATWTGQDIGGPALAGSQALSNGVWTVAGSGSDIGGTADQFHFVSQSLVSDGTTTAQVLSQTNTNSRAQAGVMLRLTTNAGSPFYAAVVTPSSGIFILDRTTQGANVSTLATIAGTVPVYLRVERSGITYTAYTSANGSSWTAVAGSTVTLTALSGTLMAGMAVSSHTLTSPKLSTATFNTVSVQLTWAGQDIGAPTLAGSDSMNSGVWTIAGAGSDIGGVADQFHFVSQALPGDGGVRARVLSQSNTNSRAKVGVMVRLSTSSAAPFYAVVVTPQRGIMVLDRTTQGANVNTLATIATGIVPVYLQVMRTGTTYVAYTSSDGVTWTAVSGSSVSIPALTGSLLAGLVVTSHNTTALDTAVFDNVSTP